MRVFQNTYRDAAGKAHKTRVWYVEFTDHLERRRRVSGVRDRKHAEAIGRNIERLVRCRASGERPDPMLTKWVETCPPGLRARLGRIGLLDTARIAALRPLLAHLDGESDAPGFRQVLAARGNTARQVNLVCTRARRVIEGCRFTYWSDISPSRVMTFLDELRADSVDERGNVKRGISAQTFNFYLAAFKQFCRWMVKDGRASESPVAHLDGLNVRTDRRHDRRALSVEEIRWLLETTRNEPERFGMTGPQRAMLYRLAMETGLRANELASLTRASFALDGPRPTVTVLAAYSKHRREDVLPLRADTAAELRELLALSMPDALAFNVPRGRCAAMFRADLAAARAAWLGRARLVQDRRSREGSSFLSYRDGSGRVADFHALRHTCGSLLAASGAHPKVAQSVMRHSTIDLTMSRYTHVFAGQEADAVAALPNLAAPAQEAAAATGTDNVQAVQDAPGCARTNECAPDRPAGAGPDTPMEQQAATGYIAAVAASRAEPATKTLARNLAREGGFQWTSADFGGRETEAGRDAPESENAQVSEEKRAFAKENGEVGIRTRDTGMTPYNGLANRRFQPLSHLSGRACAACGLSMLTIRAWADRVNRGWWNYRPVLAGRSVRRRRQRRVWPGYRRPGRRRRAVLAVRCP